MGESSLAQWKPARSKASPFTLSREKKNSHPGTLRQEGSRKNSFQMRDSSFPSRICLGCASSREYAHTASNLIFQSPWAVIYSYVQILIMVSSVLLKNMVC